MGRILRAVGALECALYKFKDSLINERTRDRLLQADKSRMHRSISRAFTRCARMHAMEEDDEFQKLMLAKVLLDGYTENDARGLPCKKYLAKDIEPQARSALASILRNQKPLDHDLIA
jgi:hypothetical protein